MVPTGKPTRKKTQSIHIMKKKKEKPVQRPPVKKKEKPAKRPPVKKKGPAKTGTRPVKGPAGSTSQKPLSLLIPTGLSRLDELLKGGIPPKSSVLLLGKSFMGIDVLENNFIVNGLNSKVPCLIVTTDKPASDIRASLLPLVPRLEVFEQKGFIKYLDTYSSTVGLKDDNKAIIHQNGVIDMASMINITSRVQHNFSKKFAHHRVVFRTPSTLLTKTDQKRALHFMETFQARCKAYGGVCLYNIIEGLHTEAEIGAIENLMNGVILFKRENERKYLKAQGLGEVATRDWIEYKHDDINFEVVGSFHLDRIL